VVGGFSLFAIRRSPFADSVPGTGGGWSCKTRLAPAELLADRGLQIANSKPRTRDHWPLAGESPLFLPASTKTLAPAQLMHSGRPDSGCAHLTLSGTLLRSQARGVSKRCRQDSALPAILSRVNRRGNSGSCPADWRPGIAASSRSSLARPSRSAWAGWGVREDGSVESTCLRREP